MANRGTLTDHFGLASASLILVDSSDKTPVAKSRAEATDENGDIADAEWYGGTDIFDVSNVYALKSGTLNLNTLKLGEQEPGVIISSISVATDNGEWPKITVTGQLGNEAVTAPTGKANTWTLPSITLTAIKSAQPMGFTVSAGSLQNNTFEFSCDIAELTDGTGEPAAHGVSGAVGALSAELMNTADEAPAVSLTLSGLTLSQGLSTIEPAAEYHTASFSAEVILARDADPSP